MSEQRECRFCKHWTGEEDLPRKYNCQKGILHWKPGFNEGPPPEFGCNLFESRERVLLVDKDDPSKDSWWFGKVWTPQQQAVIRQQLEDNRAYTERFEQLVAIKKGKRYELAAANSAAFCSTNIPMTVEENARRSVSVADALLAELAKGKL